MVLYNISLLTDSGNIGGVATAANTFSEGILFGMGSVVFFFIFLLALKRSGDFDEALLVSSFLSFLVGSIFAYGGYVNIIFPLTYLIVAALTAMYMWVVKNPIY